MVSERSLVDHDADSAIAALFDAHWARMVRVAVVMLGNLEAAEDAVQDAFLGVHAAWGRVRDREQAVGYLHRSVVNTARSRLRRRALALRHRPQPPADSRSAEELVLATELGGPVLAALRALPRRERETVLFRHYLDLSEQQTADALGIRIGSVKGYASRGLATLRAALRDTGVDTEGGAA